MDGGFLARQGLFVETRAAEDIEGEAIVSASCKGWEPERLFSKSWLIRILTRRSSQASPRLAPATRPETLYEPGFLDCSYGFR